MKVEAYKFKLSSSLMSYNDELLPIKRNGNNLNIYNLQGEIIETVDLPKELERSFDIVPEKRILIESNLSYVTGRLVRFVDLHRHSGYSMLDGATKIKPMAEKTELYGAITDHGYTFGVFDYYKNMKKLNKKPIIGAELYTESIDGELKRNHLVVLVKNETGYKNLSKIITLSEENKYYVSHVSYDLLEKYSEGLIILSACLGGEVSKALANNDYDLALEIVETYQGIFGEDYYLEMQSHGIDKEKIVNPLLKKLSNETGVKLVGTIDSHYLNKEDRIAQEALLGMGNGQTISSPNRFVFDGDGYHVHEAEEFEELFKDNPELIYNAYEIIEKIDFNFITGKHFMPHFQIPNNFKDEKEYFIHLCEEGFKNKFLGTEHYVDEVYKERLNHEISIITNMGFEGYFLIVSDFIRYAKSQGIMIGPGRGSAAGSLVSYVLDIIDLDPIEHDLLFERFLNPDRISMPDIDVDIEDSRRDEVLEYVKNKYGMHSTSGIITFGTFAAKTAMRDVAKFLDFPSAEVNKLREAIPAKVGITLEEAYEQSPEFKKMIDSSPSTKTAFDIAKTLEGIPRHISQHACGYIITDGNVSDYVPDILVQDKETKEYNRVASFNMIELEELGLLKMDFLGLRSIGVVGNAIKSVNESGQSMKLEDIDPYNPYLYKLIGSGNTGGLFQIESAGMRNLVIDMYYDVEEKIKQIETKYQCSGFLKLTLDGPNSDHETYLKEMKKLGREFFDRLVAVVSLYRPGPMDYIPQYIEGMKNPESIHYDTIELEPILKSTYGVIVYQEQVQRIARDLAGYSLARGDLLRRAMGKKDMDIMKLEKEVFIHGIKTVNSKGEEEIVPGCIANGIDEEVANIVWDKMVEFANYAFNKSHSAAYSTVTIQMTHMKFYYPLHFYKALLNSVITKQDELKPYLADLRKNGYVLKNPSILYSDLEFTIEDGGIRFGLQGLRNLGVNAKPIIEERIQNGQFESLQDFMYRMRHVLNKSPLESLIYSGSLDEFNVASRKDLIEQTNHLVDYVKDLRDFEKIDDLKVDELFDFYKDLSVIEIENTGKEFDKKDLVFHEYHYTGVFITEHPLAQYEREMEYLKVISISDLTDENEYVNHLNQSFKVIGIPDFKKVFTKKNDLMFSGTLEDETGIINVVMFPNKIDESMENLDKDLEREVVLIEGVFQENDFGLQLIINKLTPISEITVKKEKAIMVNLSSIYEMDDLTEILNSELGNVEVYVKTPDKILKFENKIELSLSQELKLKEKFGTIRRAF